MIGRLTKFMAMRKTFVGVQAGDGRGRDALSGPDIGCHFGKERFRREYINTV